MSRVITAIVGLLLSFSTALSADYLPLSKGNKWTYSMSNGMQMTMEITGFADVEGVRCAIVETDIGMQKGREYIATDSQGLKAYMAETQGQKLVYDKPVLRIRLPFIQGQTWEASINQFGVPLLTRFESLGTEEVEIPLGEFECIVVRSSIDIPGQGSMVSDSYYADGQGLVLQKIRMAAGELISTLTSVNVQPSKSRSPSPTPVKPREMRCPKCNAVLDANAKFCPQCGTKITPLAVVEVCPKCKAKLPKGAKFCPSCGEKIVGLVPGPQPEQNRADRPKLEKYQSQDGKLVLYKPESWTVHEEDLGEGIRAAYVMEPREEAVVVFMNFPVDDRVKDSVALSARCLMAVGEEFSDLKVTKITSTPERDRTIAEITLTDEGEKGIGHGYFFHTRRIGTVYLMIAYENKWSEFRPKLAAIVSNLAFTPEGVAAVQQKGKQLAEQTDVPQGQVLSPVALIRRATQRTGKQIPLQPAVLPDRSMSMQIPQGWSIEGEKLRYVVVNNPQTKTHGMSFVIHTIIPTNLAIPGAITAPYQPPAQALSLLLEYGGFSKNIQVISQYPAEQAAPEMAEAVQQMRAQGLQVDARLIYVNIQNIPTGKTIRGLYSVMCSIMPMSPVWQVSIQGSWAPENEYDEWLPLYQRLEKTVQINQQWMGAEMQNRAFRQQQLNRNLQKSIAESNQAFDDYMGSLQNASRSRDYIGWMQSQTTLGQGTWVSEYEGGRVYQTDHWGITGPEGRIDDPAYNTTYFTGENPWDHSQLKLVDSRAEYERHLAAIR
jgi:RNA polymerase subunit RPABC4/transcription elongation factor Spt4